MSLQLTFTVIFLVAMLSISFAGKAQENFSDVYQQYNNATENENREEAVTFAKQALALGEIKFGKLSENTANLKFNLALSLSNNKQGLESFNTFSSVVEDYVRLYGKNSEQHFRVTLEQIVTAKDFTSAELRKSPKRFKEVVGSAEDIAEELSEEYPEKAGVVYYQLAKVINKTQLVSQFFKRAERITEIAEKNLIAQVGESDLRTLETRYMLGKFASGKKNKSDAIKYFEQVVSTVNSEIDTSHPYELAAHASLVDLYERKGNSDKATKHCMAIGRMKPWSDDIKPLPLFRKDPEYPMSMARKSKDGIVELEFVITSYGFVKDIKVLNANHDSFAEKAKAALAKWRYAPKIVDGQAVESPKQRIRLEFTMG